MVHKNIHGHLNELPHQDRQYGVVNRILVSSYNDLPYPLKPCFLYLRHYPEDWEIQKKELICLWIAEGFIPKTEEFLMEDLGEKFLEELIDRSLVQVSRRGYTGTNVKTCRVHDLFRDLCTKKAREEKFLEIIQQPSAELDVTLAEPMLRRICIHPSERKVHLKGEHPKLRSLLLPEKETLQELCISKCKSFKFLRVLTLLKRCNYKKWHVSNEIGDLLHLRYLKLECWNEMILPQSIGRLKSLYTLYIKYHTDIVIPDAVFKLERLRHIVIKRIALFGRGFRLRLGFTSENIETLKYIMVDEQPIENNEVLRWTNIQSLGIVFTRTEYVKPILILLTKLQLLGSVSLEVLDDSNLSYLDLEPLSRCYHLSKLRLAGGIKDDPHPSCHLLNFLPPNIVKLTLFWCRTSQDPMGVLEKLCHLRILYLEGVYNGSKMMCSANGFPQLDSLQMIGLEELKEWEIEKGAMPCLRRLELADVDSLGMLPEGLRFITTLQEMILTNMSSSLKQRIKVIDGREGEDFYKVCHIPSIHVF
ncbi:hypothetical protein Gotur_020139 [Gossypium turneri]